MSSLSGCQAWEVGGLYLEYSDCNLHAFSKPGVVNLFEGHAGPITAISCHNSSVQVSGKGKGSHDQ